MDHKVIAVTQDLRVFQDWVVKLVPMVLKVTSAQTVQMAQQEPRVTVVPLALMVSMVWMASLVFEVPKDSTVLMVSRELWVLPVFKVLRVLVVLLGLRVSMELTVSTE
jgi:hypothetical protein